MKIYFDLVYSLSIEKVVLSRGTLGLLIKCWTKCSNLLTHPQPSAKPVISLWSILAGLARVAVPPFIWPLEDKGINILSTWPQRSPMPYTLSSFVPTVTEHQCSLLSLLHCCSSSSQANPWFPPSFLERKGSKLWLESRSTDSPVVLGFVTLGAYS